MNHLTFLIGVSVGALVLIQTASAQLVEEERLAEYQKRNYTWPMAKVFPDTEGWTRRMDRRMAQVERVADNDLRYNGWMAVMASAIAMPSFTESGWGLTRAPTDVMKELMESLHNGLPTAQEESYINVIQGGERPLFVHQPKLNQKVLDDLKPMHEEWAGVELEGSLSYGLRVYRNNSRLFMHVDKLRTHVISCILHVDHSEDSEPWPILIEDFQGNTNEVVLESGDLLFYESSKCIHGRPKPLNGSWYSSLFVHYRPVGWEMDKAELETHYAIPSHWHTAKPLDPSVDELVMVGTSMTEPNCPYEWCGTNDTVKWRGPAIEGKVISTGFQYPDASNKGDEL
mmetsp:Transcript_16681/g.27668  ORF Transcript_16681/g.27668 Transcript_16681/m.27668 type:complete len:342 (+) Transcript_16681:133-1158(+)|eukprot:CAMPEP_0119014568 /NCGR_PEP_ID=MMETSP1176-20130426/9966_1 /TAXON_ID=265551 /ORGANISM="Synedropsis recta cf, Strain CCMP1620" /LENGTH=341 /DNA_ID=CAMNT_0006967771 /DNA_START=97 /DNA_END=1122 /DNA_ORIENTATION=+